MDRYDLRAADSFQLAAALEWCEDDPQGRVLATQQLPLPHRDPADRFLAATAQVMDLTVSPAATPRAIERRVKHY
ncbi:MAG: hypothetical protein ABSC64_22055 [Candidatus Korobacteraceae bacterium]